MDERVVAMRRGIGRAAIPASIAAALLAAASAAFTIGFHNAVRGGFTDAEAAARIATITGGAAMTGFALLAILLIAIARMFGTRAMTARERSLARLEKELHVLLEATAMVRDKIEESSARAAKASHAAVEAAGLARAGALRLEDETRGRIEAAALRAGAVIGALTQAVTRLSEAVTRLEGGVPVSAGPLPAPEEVDALLREAAGLYATLGQLGPRSGAPAGEAARVLEQLIGDLEALDDFVRRRKDLRQGDAGHLTASLVDAADRLNAVAERVTLKIAV